MKATIWSAFTMSAVFIPSTAISADMFFDCRGVERKDGSAYERNIRFELEFFRASHAYRKFSYRGGVRYKSAEGRYSSDNNEIIWGRDRDVIDRSSGQMIREITRDGETYTQYMTCTRQD